MAGHLLKPKHHTSLPKHSAKPQQDADDQIV